MRDSCEVKSMRSREGFRTLPLLQGQHCATAYSAVNSLDPGERVAERGNVGRDILIDVV